MTTTPSSTELLTEHVSLAICVHADAKVGKTWLAATAPKPMVLLDAEGSSRFIPKTPTTRRIVWNPANPIPPGAGETWDIAVVHIREYADAARAYQWLAKGNHPFKSVGVDPLDRLQKRCIDKVGGSDPDAQMQQDDWGRVLRHVEQLLNQLHDLVLHPTHPLDCVVMTAHTVMKDGKWTPFVKGQLATTLPGIPDVIGYMYVGEDGNGRPVRKLRIAPSPTMPALVGDRTHELSRRLGAVISNPHLGKMLEVLRTNDETQEEVTQ